MALSKDGMDALTTKMEVAEPFIPPRLHQHVLRDRSRKRERKSLLLVTILSRFQYTVSVPILLLPIRQTSSIEPLQRNVREISRDTQGYIHGCSFHSRLHRALSTL